MGKPKQTVIEINGKRYDAHTGQLLKTATPVSHPVKAKPTRVQDVSRSVATSHRVHKTVQRSQTLMRTAVKRPAQPAKLKPAAAAHKPVADIRAAQPKPVSPATLLTKHHDSARIARASQVERSKLVRKFTDFAAVSTPLQAQPVATKVAVLPVQPAPSVPLSAHKPLDLKSSILEKGLQRATSHNETFDHKPAKRSRKKRPRLVTYAAGALATLLLAGFIGYQYLPNVSVRYAAARSGIQAGLPGYQPSGFSLSRRIQYTPGQITLSYASNTDDRQFTITQRESNWNSDALKSSYVLGASTHVQTYEDKGRTIYLYGDNSATWVSNGVWYDIKGDSELTSDQLIRIATSL